VTLRELLSHSAMTSVHGFPGYDTHSPLPNLEQILDGIQPANTAAVRVEGLPDSGWRYSGGVHTENLIRRDASVRMWYWNARCSRS
jgi:hypothetical protein